VSDRLAAMVAELGAGGLGETDLSDVGAVVGATVPERLATLREQMPKAIFLLPGVGPQGGAVERLGAAFGPGRGAGLVPVSRGIVAAHEQLGGDPAAVAREQAARLRQLLWAVSG